MMDRCERTNENGESTFWEGHWLERPIKNFFDSPKSNARKKMEKVQEICEEMEKISDDALSQFFQVMFKRVTDDELAMVENRLVTYGKMMLSYMFEMKARGVLDCAKLPHAFDIGWHTFKSSPSTCDEEERKRVTLKAFDDCLEEEKSMEEMYLAFAELSTKN